MEFKIREAIDLNASIVISNDKACLEKAKAATSGGEPIFVELDFDALNLGTTLYGKNKAESIEIQKQNCKKLKSFYKLTNRVIKKRATIWTWKTR